MSASSTRDSFESFPLKDGKRFVVWNYEHRGGKPTKVLKIPTARGIFGASHSDPETWGTCSVPCVPRVFRGCGTGCCRYLCGILEGVPLFRAVPLLSARACLEVGRG